MNRSWWPFEVIPDKSQSPQLKAEIAFLVRASELGLRAYTEGSDFGAVADDGRECRIEWRGNHRRELLLIDTDKTICKQVFASRDQGTAFAQAAETALAWLPSLAASSLKAAPTPELSTGDSPVCSMPIRGAATRN